MVNVFLKDGELIVKLLEESRLQYLQAVFNFRGSHFEEIFGDVIWDFVVEALMILDEVEDLLISKLALLDNLCNEIFLDAFEVAVWG